MKLTTFLNAKYFPGLWALAYSLSKYGQIKDIDFHVIWDGEPVYNYEYLLELYGFNPITHRLTDFPKVPDIKGTQRRLILASKKMVAWLLPPDDTYTYIDVDMICKKDAREMLDFKHFSAERRPDAPGFCGGMWTYEPNSEIFQTLITDILPSKKWKLSDQDIMNEYFTKRNPDQLNILDWKWNTSKREIRQPNWHELFEEAIFVHYHGAYKPWLATEPMYELSHALWHSIYSEALFSYEESKFK